MKPKTYLEVEVPTREEFAERFPQYGPRARAEGSDLFDLVMQPGVFVDADVLTRILGLPAITAVARATLDLRGGTLSMTDRQFVGALVCSLMECNGYHKTHRKRSIPIEGWRNGEVYETYEEWSLALDRQIAELNGDYSHWLKAIDYEGLPGRLAELQASGDYLEHTPESFAKFVEEQVEARASLQPLMDHFERLEAIEFDEDEELTF